MGGNVSIIKKLSIVALVIAFAMLFCSCDLPGANESRSDEVHIAIQPSAAFIPLFVAKEKGWIEEALTSYGVTVEWEKFESGPPMNDSLLSEDSDIGVIGDVPVVTVCAPGNDVIVIATAAQAADSYAVLVPADSDIRSAADLKGKRVGATYGSTAHNMIEKYLNTAGLTIDDINLVNITVGDAKSVLANGQADAISIWEPSVTRLTSDGSIRILASGSECGLAGTNGIVAREKYAKANPDVVSEILRQYKRAADELPKLDEETLTAVAGELGVTREQMDQIIPKFIYSVKIVPEDLDALNDTIWFLNENKILRKEYDIRDRADGSYYKVD
jgi:sulfonate transport system substrate-binding protein